MDYTVIDPKNTVIDARIGKNTIIEPFCVVGKNCRIGENCIIGSFSYLVSSTVGDFSEIRASRLTDSEVGCRTTVGPDAHLRQNSVVGDGCRVGNFVELKNSVLGDGSKASHLAYIGDAVVGKNCNVGCGAVFVNFDGVSKHRTVVGDNVFIGSNCNGRHLRCLLHNRDKGHNARRFRHRQKRRLGQARTRVEACRRAQRAENENRQINAVCFVNCGRLNCKNQKIVLKYR